MSVYYLPSVPLADEEEDDTPDPPEEDGSPVDTEKKLDTTNESVYLQFISLSVLKVQEFISPVSHRAPHLHL